MSVHAGPRPVSADGLRAAVGRLAVVWPVAITGLVYLLFLGAQLSGAHGDPSVFVQFGHRFLAVTHPPAGSPIAPGLGYDGQLYWLQAHDPLLRHLSTIDALARVNPAFSLQRVAYPALAWLLVAGHVSALGWSLLATNVVAVLGLTAGVAVYAQRRGMNPAWALVVGLAPGLLLSTGRDLSDVLAVAGMTGALLCWRSGRAWAAGALLTLSVLSREPMMLFVVAIGVELAVRCVRALPSPRAVGAILARGLPAVLLPAVTYVGWRSYALGRMPVHGSAAAPGGLADTPLLPPFNDFWVAAQHALHGGAAPAAFTLSYLALTAAAVVVSLGLLRRGLSAATVGAVLYGCLVLPVVFLTDQIALTRYTLPLFLALFVAGMERRSRPALAVCAAGSATLLLLPLLSV